MRQVQLSLKSLDLLRRPIKGDGGFQNLMRRIQAGLRGGCLHVAQEDLDALLRATKGRHAGGFQRQARDIVVEALLQRLRAEGFPMRPDREPPTQPARVLPFRQRRLPLEKGDE